MDTRITNEDFACADVLLEDERLVDDRTQRDAIARWSRRIRVHAVAEDRKIGNRRAIIAVVIASIGASVGMGAMITREPLMWVAAMLLTTIAAWLSYRPAPTLPRVGDGA